MAERIVILGAGESGTGAALLAKAKGYDVFVSDQGQLKDKYKVELSQHGIEFEEGRHTESKILNADLIIKSPGIPDKTDVIKHATDKNIPIIDEIEFAFRYAGKSKVIAITGTNGKTTTTLLTYHLMKEAGLKVALAGNVGFSMARQLIDKTFDWFVLELSSFQLDGIQTFKPEIGILLNITPDHLDRYSYNMQNYVNSKFQIVKNMGPQDNFIFYGDDQVIAKEVTTKAIAANKIEISLEDGTAPVKYANAKMNFGLNGKSFFITQDETTLRGPHNLINTMAAVSAVLLAGISVESIKTALKTFKNAPHRLEDVGTINGVQFINDSKATNVDSVVYALGSYDQPLVWIAGGIDKGNDYKLIMDQVKRKVKTLICLGKDNEKLKKAFEGIVPKIMETQSVKELVRMALQSATEGDVVLLSPACASFDLFKNYEDRGNQFREAVRELAQRQK
jgi:UDP-N-acetylmuramoylalanine--D-glutamate ligase